METLPSLLSILLAFSNVKVGINIQEWKRKNFLNGFPEEFLHIDLRNGLEQLTA